MMKSTVCWIRPINSQCYVQQIPHSKFSFLASLGRERWVEYASSDPDPAQIAPDW